MLYIEKSQKTVQEVVEAIQEKCSQNKFGVLHIHNIKETLISKGKDFKKECQVLDICNPDFAIEFLGSDMSISSIMPCKISVYEQDNETIISMNSIVQLVDDINPDLIDTASRVQEGLLKVIEQAK